MEIKVIIPWDIGIKLKSQGSWRVSVIWLVLFGMLKGRHSDSDSENDSESETNIKINSPKGSGDEMLVLGDLEDYCNMVSSILFAERKTSRSICDIWGYSDSDSVSDSESKGLGWRGETAAQNTLREGKRENSCSLGE